MNRFYILIVIVVMTVFSSCNVDERDIKHYEDVSGDFWNGTSGTYRGKIYADVEGVAIDTFWQHAIVESDNRNKMTFSINSLKVDDMSFGDVFFKNVYYQETPEGVFIHGNTLKTLSSSTSVNIDLNGSFQDSVLKYSITIYGNSIRTVNLKMDGVKLDVVPNDDSSIKKFFYNNPLIIDGEVYGENSLCLYVSDTTTITDSTEIFITPTFVLADGATISYPDSVMNVVGNKAKYTVWAEDSIHSTVYNVILYKASVVHYRYNQWRNLDGWEEPNGGWATNNAVAKSFMDQGLYSGDYIVTREKGVDVGEWAARMETVLVNPTDTANCEILAGSLFQGTFDLTMAAPLYGPEYGVLFTGQPNSIKGYFKYLPSSDVYDGNRLLNDTILRNDTCLIAAVLYEVDFVETKLDSVNYMNDPRVIAYAKFETGRYVPEYTTFSLYFFYLKNYYPTKRYKIALICTPSRDADKKKGAPGSVLTVGGIDVRYSKK